jgi:hypothetical protein
MWSAATCHCFSYVETRRDKSGDKAPDSKPATNRRTPSALFLLQLAMRDGENHFLMIEIHRAGFWNLPLPGEGGNLPER